jgi:hypothetical protein
MLNGKIISHYLMYGCAQDNGYVGSPQVEIAHVWKIEDLKAQEVVAIIYFIFEFGSLVPM